MHAYLTFQDPPFIMLRNDHHTRKGNDKYQGFLIDLLGMIAQRLDFKYELYESPDGNYGSENESGEWNGMIRELIIGVSIYIKVCYFTQQVP